MATIKVTNGVLDITADTNDNQVNFNGGISNDDGSITGLVTIVTATTGISFGLGTADGGYQWPEDSKFWMTWKPGELYFKKVTATDTFVITV